MHDKTATLTKAHENNLVAIIRDYRHLLQKYFGDRLEQVIRTWYNQERQRFEYPDGLEAGPAKVLDFVPILTRRAVEERIRRLLAGPQQAFEGAA
jgi:hypothetical protein